MNKSDSIQELAAALAKAQAEMQPAAMTATNPFLHNRYADLGSIIQTARPVLAKHNLAVSQLVTGTDTIGVTTILMHASGEWIESTVSMPTGEERGKSQAQVAGSIITYLRRYSLAAILGMYADEDADGNAPQKHAEKAHAEKASAEKPLTDEAGMTLEDAKAVTNADGEAYGDLDSEKLTQMANSIARKLNTPVPPDQRKEYRRKAAAIKLILADRATTQA